MLKRYKKGMTTRNNIIHVAKTLFYFNGYKKTTVQKISDLANVNLGLLSYYFKTKKNIVKICFVEYLDKINHFVLEEVDSDDDILQLLVSHRIFFDIIFKNANNLSFYKEIVCNKIIYDVMYDFVLSKYKEINENKNFNLDEDIIKCLVCVELGGRCKVLSNYFNNQFDITYDDLVNVLISCTPKLLNIDKKTMDNYIVESKKIVKGLDYSYINFLINNN